MAPLSPPSLGHHRRGPEDPGRSPRHHRLPWAAPSPRLWRPPPARGVPLCVRVRPQPGSPPPERHRLETKAAMDKYGIQADIIIGCAGGGSNVGGLISPFVGQMPGRGRLPDHRRGARPPAPALPGASSPTISVTPAWSAPGQDVYLGLRLHPLCQPCRRPAGTTA